MIRLVSLLWLAVVAVSGFATFKMKYAVQDIEEELAKVRKQTITEQQEIHVLRAEWTRLNQPERLMELNRRLLSLAAIQPQQLQHKIEDIPLRPVPDASEPRIASSANSAPPPTPSPDLARAPQPATTASAEAIEAEADSVVAAAALPKPTVAKLRLIASAEAAPANPAAAPKAAKPDPRPQPGKARSPAQLQSLDRLIDAIAGNR